MNTFNLGFLIGENSNLHGGPHIIVCASEDPIDIYQIGTTATNSLPSALARNQDPRKAIAEIARIIKQKCGCEAVVVSADALLQAVPINPLPFE